ncbi:hypothetical protein MnTg04_00871 [bacterium MnTg04]|nr:hypothetical protein MnTg04_00871 [bacterium MnTg04]
MRRLKNLLIGRQSQAGVQQSFTGGLVFIETAEHDLGVREFEVVFGHFHLVLVKNIAITDSTQRAIGPDQVEHAVDILQKHRDAFQAVSYLTGYRAAVETAGLLKISKLRDLHAIEPYLPAQTPGAQGWRFPVVLDETDIMNQRIDTQRKQRPEIQILDIRRRRLDDHLKLVVMLEAKWVVAIASIGRPAGGLYVCRTPRLGSDRAQKSRRMKGSGAHFLVVGLQQHATLRGPVLLQGQDQILKSQGRLPVGAIAHYLSA